MYLVCWSKVPVWQVGPYGLGLRIERRCLVEAGESNLGTEEPVKFERCE